MTDSGEKVYPPSEEKLRKLREKAQWFKSADLMQAAGLTMCTVILASAGEWAVSRLVSLMEACFTPLSRARDSEVSLLVAPAANAWRESAVLVLLIAAAVGLATALAGFLQTGSLVSMDPVSPKSGRINPGVKAKEIFFGPRTYQKFALSVVKFTFVAIVVVSSAGDTIRELVTAPRSGPNGIAHVAGWALLTLLWKGAGAFLVIGLVDFLLERRQFMLEQRMSHEELKREQREQEPSEETRRAIEERRAAILSEVPGGLNQVGPEVTVVVVNPTHIAVAIAYDFRLDPLAGRPPRIIAKGTDEYARRIVARARRFRVPVRRDVSLARALIRVRLGRPIPPKLFEAVTIVLRSLDPRFDRATD